MCLSSSEPKPTRPRDGFGSSMCRSRQSGRPRSRSIGAAWIAVLAVGHSGCGEEAGRSDPGPGDERSSSSADVDSRDVDDPAAATGFPQDTSPDIDPRVRAMLERAGYLVGSESAGELTGVVVHDADRVQPGVHLLVSAHVAGAQLMDLHGETLHTWTCAFETAYPDREAPAGESATRWRRAWLRENGEVLAIYEGAGLIAVDRDSRLLWARDVHAHHDLHLLDDGTMWVLTREAKLDPELHPTQPVLEDFVGHFDANGNELQRFSVLRAVYASPLVPQVWKDARVAGDVLHTNAVVVLDGRMEATIPAFAAGNLLLSVRRSSALVILDGSTGELLWIWQPDIHGQHDPHVLDDRRILFFDNRSKEPFSRVVELDVLSGGVRWQYRGSEAEPFHSKTCGLVQRLDNGNTLVTESNHGRAFEVAPDGEIVWDYRSPYRADDAGEIVANLFEVTRVDRDTLPWLDERP